MPDPERIHPYFTAELERALGDLPDDEILELHGTPALTPSGRAAIWLVAYLSDRGWKIEPSRQRRMQLDPPQPPPEPMRHQHFAAPPPDA